MLTPFCLIFQISLEKIYHEMHISTIYQWNPKHFVYSVVVLTERELGSMNVAKEQNEHIFGDNFMIHEERAKVLELLEDIEEAKQ